MFYFSTYYRFVGNNQWVFFFFIQVILNERKIEYEILNVKITARTGITSPFHE